MSPDICSSIIPKLLLNTLGRFSRQFTLADALLKEKPPIVDAFKHQNGNVYPLHIPGSGMDLMLLCVNPDTTETQWLWGLDSVTIHTSASSPVDHWKHWPETLNAEKATLSSALALFGEPMMQSATMALFDVTGPEAQNWALHCEFDGHSSRLKTLTLARSDDWQSMPDVAIATDANVPTSAVSNRKGPTEAVKVAAPVIDVATAAFAVMCGSRGRVPKTGVYEGRLPPDHRDAAYFGQSQGRFVHRKEGSEMILLGVIPEADEAKVMWTWLRD